MAVADKLMGSGNAEVVQAVLDNASAQIRLQPCTAPWNKRDVRRSSGFDQLPRGAARGDRGGVDGMAAIASANG